MMVCVNMFFAKNLHWGYRHGVRRKFVTTSISLKDQDLLRRAQQRADRLGLSFSQYITMLIKDDLEQRGPLILKETPKPPSQENEHRGV